MIKLYDLIRHGDVTDPQAILDLAERFEAIANHPEISQQFDYDAGRAAHNLRARLHAMKAAEKSRASDPDDTTEIKRPTRRTFNDNLAAGG